MNVSAYFLIYPLSVFSIDTNDYKIYGAGIIEGDFQQHKDFVDENHGHVLTGDVRIITNSKVRKLASNCPNFCESMSTNWNKCKREMDIGLGSSIE